MVAIVSDTTRLQNDSSQLSGCLEALSRQVDLPSLEVIVPYHDRVGNIDEVRHRFPEMKYIHVDDLQSLGAEAGSHEHHDELLARGLAVASGEIIGLLEDHARPDVHWCARVVAAHRQDIAAAEEREWYRPVAQQGGVFL